MPRLLLHPSDPASFVLDTTWAEKELVKQLPGARWDSQLKTWYTPRTWAICLQARGLFGDRLEVDPQVKEWAWAERKRVEQAVELRGLFEPVDDGEAAAWWTSGLHPFQQVDVSWARATDLNATLTNEMGTGKTISALTTLRASPETSLPALVICPNSVKENWATEAKNWWPEATVYLVHGGAATRRKQLEAAAEDENAFVVINIEAIRLHSRLAPYGNVRLKRCVDCGGNDEKVKTTQCEVHLKELNEFGFRSVVFDEAHRMKEPKAKQTRAAWAVMHGETVEYRLALTGTPIANHVGDLWSIMHGVDPEEYPNRSKFMDRYALLTWNAGGGLDVVGLRPDTKQELFGFLDRRVRRVTKSQVLTQLPKKYRSIRHAPMIPKMKKAYKELESELVTRLDDGSILFAPNSLTASLRLLQMSSSYGTVEELGDPDPETGRVKTRYVLSEPSPKLDVLEEILDELEGRQVAVCALSRQLIDLAAKRLDDRYESYGMITGTVKKADRDRALDEFQAGKLRCLLFTLQAGGTGLTMTAADTIVFLQRSWSLVDNKQAEDRVHRIGSERHEAIHVIDVVAPESIEERQIERVHDKLRMLEEIVRDGHAEFEPDTDDLREDL